MGEKHGHIRYSVTAVAPCPYSKLCKLHVALTQGSHTHRSEDARQLPPGLRHPPPYQTAETPNRHRPHAKTATPGRARADATQQRHGRNATTTKRTESRPEETTAAHRKERFTSPKPAKKGMNQRVAISYDLARRAIRRLSGCSRTAAALKHRARE